MLSGFVSDSGTSGKGRWAIPKGAPETRVVKATMKVFMNADMVGVCVSGLE